MKIGIAQINTIVGDIEGNRSLILEAYKDLCSKGAELVLSPELAICGYPPRDLLFKSEFALKNEQALESIAGEVGEVPLITGWVEKNYAPSGKQFYNSVSACANGRILFTSHKCLLPTYDVFDENRYFESGKEPILIQLAGKKIAITVCEDIWNHPSVKTRNHYSRNPLESLEGKKVDVLLNLSASPWHLGKEDLRNEILHDIAKSYKCSVVYCNLVGGNDELIFDGHSLAYNSTGDCVAELKAFEQELRVIDTESKGLNGPPIREIESIEKALTMGLRDYSHKSGFKKALIGLSGGIDSAVTAVLAVEALGSENVIGISLPSTISSEHSRVDAEKLAKNLGMEFHTVPIEKLVKAAENSLENLFTGREKDVTEENIQARSRGLIMMALSNKLGALLLTTGNKSELAVGYCTLYGDMCGGLAVISDLAKMKVFELARFMNRNKEVIPVNTIEKPPSAELRPDQIDEDSLPSYEILDEILEMYVEEFKSSEEIIKSGFEDPVVRDIIRKVDLNEYKRKQAAPGLKITPLAFGIGRRIPLVQKYIS
jgi:NAD+ synthase (glutamine-hydrolysing)